MVARCESLPDGRLSGSFTQSLHTTFAARDPNYFPARSDQHGNQWTPNSACCTSDQHPDVLLQTAIPHKPDSVEQNLFLVFTTCTIIFPFSGDHKPCRDSLIASL